MIKNHLKLAKTKGGGADKRDAEKFKSVKSVKRQSVKKRITTIETSRFRYNKNR